MSKPPNNGPQSRAPWRLYCSISPKGLPQSSHWESGGGRAGYLHSYILQMKLQNHSLGAGLQRSVQSCPAVVCWEARACISTKCLPRCSGFDPCRVAQDIPWRKQGIPKKAPCQNLWVWQQRLVARCLSWLGKFFQCLGCVGVSIPKQILT